MQKNENLLWVEYGYFLELHIMQEREERRRKKEEKEKTFYIFANFGELESF